MLINSPVQYLFASCVYFVVLVVQNTDMTAMSTLVLLI